MREIQLTKGYCALVDDEDYEELMKYRWKANVRGEHHVYASRSVIVGGRKGKWTTIMMHRFVTHADPGLVVDHINGNTLDNRKENLRVCEQRFNAMNRRSHSEKTSRFKGVFLDKKSGRWIAGIRYNRAHRHLGYFDREIDAALAYNESAESLPRSMILLYCLVPSYRDEYQAM
jgi:hypothetical protein